MCVFVCLCECVIVCVCKCVVQKVNTIEQNSYYYNESTKGADASVHVHIAL